uniref:ferroxidase n=1 Tax=Plectus sambesii TaxID=2011161 RepID=A0A914XGI2_9BILA
MGTRILLIGRLPSTLLRPLCTKGTASHSSSSRYSAVILQRSFGLQLEQRHSVHYLFPPMPALNCPRMLCSKALTELEFDDLAENTLTSIGDYLDGFTEWLPVDADFDISYAMGVLTIKLGGGRGTYVINKQSPNKQLWLSSPVSGPKRYDYIHGQWVYGHDGVALHDLLNEEFRKLFETDRIDFNQNRDD